MRVDAAEDIDIQEISPMAWRLLRVAAGFGQRDVEAELDGIMQAHVSMLESDTRSLSGDRLREMFELYRGELTDDQVCALVEQF